MIIHSVDAFDGTIVLSVGYKDEAYYDLDHLVPKSSTADAMTDICPEGRNRLCCDS